MKRIPIALFLCACGGEFEAQAGDAAPAQVGGASGASAEGSAGAGGGAGTAAAGAGAAWEAGVEVETASPSCSEGSHLHFVGTDGAYAELPPFDFQTPFTIEAWFQIDPDGRIDIQDHAPESPCGGLLSVGNGIQGAITAAYDVFAGAALGSSWRHVAWVADTAQATIFVDGAVATQKAAGSGIPGCSGPLTVGVNTESGGNVIDWNRGRIDELRISRVVRYTGPFEPARRHAVDASTASLWHFDEPGGTDLLDETAQTGELLGGVLREADDGFGGQFCASE